MALHAKSQFQRIKVGGAVNGELVLKYCMYLTGNLSVILFIRVFSNL